MNKRKYFDVSVRFYVKSYIDILTKHIPIVPETKILEIGCGMGHFTYELDRRGRVCGIDLNEKTLKENPVRNVRVMDCTSLEFADNSFDIVFCHNVLHHVAHIERAVSEMNRVAEKYVVIIEPNPWNPVNFLAALFCRSERKILSISLHVWQRLFKKLEMNIVFQTIFGMPVPAYILEKLLPVFRLMHMESPWAWDCFFILEKNAAKTN